MTHSSISIGGVDRPCDQEPDIATARYRIKATAELNDWTRAESDSWIDVWARGTQRVVVKFDTLDRIVFVEHFVYARWVQMTGLDRAQRVINILSAER